MFWSEAITYLSHRADTICLGNCRLIISDDEARDFLEIRTVFEFNSSLNSPKLFSLAGDDLNEYFFFQYKRGVKIARYWLSPFLHEANSRSS